MADAALSEISLTPIFDNNGALVRNARLYFYKVGTLDPYTVYQDQELGAPYPFPLVTGGSGRVPPVYVGTEPYRLRIFDNANQLIEDIPWLPGAVEAGGGGGGEADTAMVTGDVIWNFSTGGVRSGFVRLNGGTIGNEASGASERANADAHNLFVYLWGQDTAALLPVLPTRGASAESDWLANKTLALPDGAHTVLTGISTMGRPPRNLFSSLTFTLGTPDKPGSRLGTATHVLTTNQMATHTHAVTDPGHLHTATQATHNHSVTDMGHTHVLSQSPHTHSVSDPGHSHGVSDPGHTHGLQRNSDITISGGIGSRVLGPGGDTTTAAVATGIGIQSNLTNISLGSASITINAQTAFTGITLATATPAITVAPGVTGITLGNSGLNEAHPNVQPTLLGTFYMKL